MFRSSLNRKIFGVFGAVLMTFNSFAWGPWDKGAKLREKWFPHIGSSNYKDPILPFIYPDAQVTHSQFIMLLEKLSAKQRRDLWKAINKDKEPSHEITAKELEKELLWVSSSVVTYPFKNEVNYHETVKWLAKKNGVHPAECAAATTFQLERRIMEKIFAKLWDKLNPNQRKKILEEAGLDPNKSVAYAALSASSLLATVGIASAVMGFSFYIIAAKTVVVVAAALVGASAATTISAVALLCGPIGWTIAGIAAVSGALILGGPNAMKTAAFVVALHSMKAAAMAKSGMDISKYVLK